jgi:hypothetical protein
VNVRWNERNARIFAQRANHALRLRTARYGFATRDLAREVARDWAHLTVLAVSSSQSERNCRGGSEGGRNHCIAVADDERLETRRSTFRRLDTSSLAASTPAQNCS